MAEFVSFTSHRVSLVSYVRNAVPSYYLPIAERSSNYAGVVTHHPATTPSVHALRQLLKFSWWIYSNWANYLVKARLFLIGRYLDYCKCPPVLKRKSGLYCNIGEDKVSCLTSTASSRLHFLLLYLFWYVNWERQTSSVNVLLPCHTELLIGLCEAYNRCRVNK